MHCTKTGCHIFIEPYGEYAYGDAFEVNKVAIFRLVERSFAGPIIHRLHYTVRNFDLWFDKASPVSTMISADFVSHGYAGKEV